MMSNTTSRNLVGEGGFAGPYSRHCVFLSFAGEERHLAIRLRDKLWERFRGLFGEVEHLEEFDLVFLDDSSIDPGWNLDGTIEKAVKNSNVFVAFISSHFINKPYPLREVKWRRNSKGGSLAVFVEDVPLPSQFEEPFRWTPDDQSNIDFDSLADVVVLLLFAYSGACSPTFPEVFASRLSLPQRIHVFPAGSSAIGVQWASLMQELIPQRRDLQEANTVLVLASDLSDADGELLRGRKVAFNKAAEVREKHSKQAASSVVSKISQSEKASKEFFDQDELLQWIKAQQDLSKLRLEAAEQQSKLPRFSVVPFFPGQATAGMRGTKGLTHIQRSDGSLDETRVRDFVRDKVLQRGKSTLATNGGSATCRQSTDEEKLMAEKAIQSRS